MKVALPLRWYFPAAPFATAGAAIVLLAVLLFAWTIIAVSGFERIDDSMLISSNATSPAASATQTRTSARTYSRPALLSWPRELSAEERLASSANLLDFVESIRHRPVPGGHYLALKAYDFCTREARLTLDAMSEGNDIDDGAVPLIITDGRQLAAQARLAQLCGTFRNRQLLALDYYLIAEEGLQTQDLRLLMARRMEKLSAQWDTASREDFHSRQTLIADVLRSGDGALVHDLASELEVILHSGQMMIGGRAVPLSESADVIDAFRLIACEQGAHCARDNEWQQVLACASAGECAPAPGIGHANALNWRNRIREAQFSGAMAIDVIPVEQRF